MNFQTYLDHFEKILNDPAPKEPYNDAEYQNYTKLNWTRLHRWLKNATLTDHITNLIKDIKTPQTWITITEPWCGDAAQIVPFIHMLAELNPLIKEEYELRDTAPFRINDYLTNGKSKSIPILVVKDEKGNDLFHWGPRPKELSKIYAEMKEKDTAFEAIKVALQKWYNEDKGAEIQKEIGVLLENH